MKFETILSNFEKEGIELYIGKLKEVTTKGTIKDGKVVWDKEVKPSSDDWQPFSHTVNYVYMKKGEDCAPLSSIGAFTHWEKWSLMKHTDLLYIHYVVSALGVAPESVIPFVELVKTLTEEYGHNRYYGMEEK
jgi:hypothetical protein